MNIFQIVLAEFLVKFCGSKMFKLVWPIFGSNLAVSIWRFVWLIYLWDSPGGKESNKDDEFSFSKRCVPRFRRAVDEPHGSFWRWFGEGLFSCEVIPWPRKDGTQTNLAYEKLVTFQSPVYRLFGRKSKFWKILRLFHAGKHGWKKIKMKCFSSTWGKFVGHLYPMCQ